MAFLFDIVPKYLTLDEGAEYLSKNLGYRCAARSLLALGEDRQFGIFAARRAEIPFVCKTRIQHPFPGAMESPYAYPLSVENIQELLLQGYTHITKIMNEILIGKDAGKQSVGWEIHPDYEPPRIELSDCRVSREHLDGWIAFNGLCEDEKNKDWRINNVLAAIRHFGFDKDNIPRGGKKSAMNDCIERRGMTEEQFNEAWKVASKSGVISHSMKKRCQKRA